MLFFINNFALLFYNIFKDEIMNNLSDIISGGYGVFFENMSDNVHELSEKLSEEEIWQKPFDFGNSFGNLVLHVCGNIQHFIGHEISKTDFIRDRESEFNTRNKVSKEVLLEEFDIAITTALSVVYAQNESDWGKDKIVLGKYGETNRFETFLVVSGHLFHHLGQMIYIVKQIEKNRA